MFELACEQIERNVELLIPGRTFRELTFESWFPPVEEYRHYSCLFHGVGQCDEYPEIYFPEISAEGVMDIICQNFDLKWIIYGGEFIVLKKIGPNEARFIAWEKKHGPVDWIAEDDTALVSGAREAGLWLAKLHTCDYRSWTPQPLLVAGELLPLSRRISKMLCRRPQFLDLALELIDVSSSSPSGPRRGSSCRATVSIVRSTSSSRRRRPR